MVDTIDTGTTMLVEGPLMPGSLRFESEPWAPFYRAGEIIRESRKVSGKQRKHASGGNSDHSEEVSDHHNHSRNIGGVPKDDPNVGNGLVGAPDCGEVMKLQVRINSETQVVEKAEFKTFAGGSVIASSSLSAEWVKCKTSRKRWPSRARISSTNSAFPRATLSDATRSSRIGRRLDLVGSPVF